MAQTAEDSAFSRLKRLSANELLLPQAKEDVEVVSASRSGGRSLQDLPVTVYVLTKEEIRMNGYTTLVDVLKSVPGFKVSKPGSGSEGELFLMRGLLGNQYAKILINGIPIQPSVRGSLGIGEQLPIAAAERIEIIFGPAAAVYGADAMAGVINIITQSAESSTFAQGNMMAGTDGYRHANFTVGGKVGANKDVFSYLMYAGMGRRDDQNIPKDGHVFNTFDYAFRQMMAGQLTEEQVEAIRKLPESQIIDIYENQIGFDNYEGGAFKPTISMLPQQSYFVGLNVKYRRFTFGYNEMYRQDHSSFGNNPLIFSYASPNNFFGEKIVRYNLSYEKSGKKWNFLGNFSYLRHHVDPRSSEGVNYTTGFGRNAYIFEASDDLFLELLLTYKPNKNWDLLIGSAQQFSSNMPATNNLAAPFNLSDYEPFTGKTPEPHPVYGLFGYNPQNIDNQSLFAQAFYHKDRWSWIFGFRLVSASNYKANVEDEDALNDISSALSPRIGLLYKLTDASSLRISYASGFRVPPSDIAFASLALPGIDFNGQIVPDRINYQRVPNPNLTPERSTSVEVAFRRSFSTKTFLDIAFFANRVSNRMNAEVLPIDLTTYPKAVYNAVDSEGRPVAIARQWVNSANSSSSLTGLQVYWRGRELEPRYNLGIDVALTLAAGAEQLPDGGTLSYYRGMPGSMLQWNISANPVKNAYLRLENVMSSSWLRRNIASEEQLNNAYARTKGYYTADFVARYKLGNHLQAFLRVLNIFNTSYAGIGASGLDVDLFYTPQLKRNFQVGINFTR